MYHRSTRYVLPYIFNVSNIITLAELYHVSLTQSELVNCCGITNVSSFHVQCKDLRPQSQTALISQAKYWVTMMSLSMAYNAPYLVWGDELKHSHFQCHCTHCIQSADVIFNKWIWKYTRRCFLPCSNRYSEGSSTSLLLGPRPLCCSHWSTITEHITYSAKVAMQITLL